MKCLTVWVVLLLSGVAFVWSQDIQTPTRIHALRCAECNTDVLFYLNSSDVEERSGTWCLKSLDKVPLQEVIKTGREALRRMGVDGGMSDSRQVLGLQLTELPILSKSSNLFFWLVIFNDPTKEGINMEYTAMEIPVLLDGTLPSIELRPYGAEMSKN
jgi:hypothetical protein